MAKIPAKVSGPAFRIGFVHGSLYAHMPEEARNAPSAVMQATGWLGYPEIAQADWKIGFWSAVYQHLQQTVDFRTKSGEVAARIIVPPANLSIPDVVRMAGGDENGDPLDEWRIFALVCDDGGMVYVEVDEDPRPDIEWETSGPVRLDQDDDIPDQVKN